MEKVVIGLDIGGTKCACVCAIVNDERVNILDRQQFETKGTWQEIFTRLVDMGKSMLRRFALSDRQVLCGISCGGPLSAVEGKIYSPPNLPGWDNVPAVQYVTDLSGWKTRLENDADACAVAEHRYGAGKGTQNFVFLTFGTGLGAGLVLNGKLYRGSTNTGGEVGHIRLENDGPVGYGKKGSFEGFCSGAGISRLADRYFTSVDAPDYYKPGQMSAKLLAQKAFEGDEHALKIFETAGHYFGRGLSVIIDILNPEVIAVGGIYMRCHQLIDNAMNETLEQETLTIALQGVKIVPCQLGEQIGDYGAIVTALL